MYGSGEALLRYAIEDSERGHLENELSEVTLHYLPAARAQALTAKPYPSAFDRLSTSTFDRLSTSASEDFVLSVFLDV